MRRAMRRKKPRATAKILGMTSLTVGLPPLVANPVHLIETRFSLHDFKDGAGEPLPILFLNL
jgi:hypothetical protein